MSKMNIFILHDVSQPKNQYSILNMIKERDTLNKKNTLNKFFFTYFIYFGANEVQLIYVQSILKITSVGIQIPVNYFCTQFFASPSSLPIKKSVCLFAQTFLRFNRWTDLDAKIFFISEKRTNLQARRVAIDEFYPDEVASNSCQWSPINVPIK